MTDLQDRGLAQRTAPAPDPARIDKPLMRGWLHAVWSCLALAAGATWLTDVPAKDRWPAAVYVAGAVGLFGTSALYHCGRWQPRAHHRLQRADHTMIFVLIGATVTPLAWATMSRTGATVLLAVMWTAVGTAALLHLKWMDAPELLVGSTFIGLGCSGAAALPWVWARAGLAPVVLVLVGGLLFISGAVLYRARRPDPWPDIFGFHEVFHVFVCAAATLQFVAIAVFVV